MQYYWRISQSHFYVNLYRKELCNDEFNSTNRYILHFSTIELYIQSPETSVERRKLQLFHVNIRLQKC